MRKKIVLVFLVGILFMFFNGCEKQFKSDKINGSENQKIDLNKGETINESETQKRNSIVYKKNEKKPFTGRVVGIYPNGKKKSDTHCKDGKQHGKRTLWHENGRKKFECNFINRRREGKQIFWFDNGQMHIKSNYKNGKQNGKESQWYSKGQKKSEGYYKDGKKIGVYISWYPDGQKQYEFDFNEGGSKIKYHRNGWKKSESYSKNNSLHGKYTEWAKNGQKILEEDRKDNKRHGKHLTWYNNGQKKSETQYKYGRRVGENKTWPHKALNTGVIDNCSNIRRKNGKIYERGASKPFTGKRIDWQPNGRKRVEINYLDGKMHGTWIEWYKNGNKKVERDYIQGKVDGIVTKWYENGNKEEEYNLKGIYSIRDGRHIRWDKDGNIIFEEFYKKGREIIRKDPIVGKGIKRGKNTITVNDIMKNFVKVTAGESKMVNIDYRKENIYSVNLDTFYISKYEVTVEEYVLFLNKTGMQRRRDKRSKTVYIRGIKGNYHVLDSEKKYPVGYVSWNDANAFCKWLSSKTGKNIHLPTEAQWEKAARGGNKSKNYKHSGSNDPDEVAWYGNNSDNKTHPVGKKKPNELGLYDMSGNVSEWCSDWYLYGYFAISPKNNPKGPDKGTQRVKRGDGNHYVDGKGHDSLSTRRYDKPTTAYNKYSGFRIARD